MGLKIFFVPQIWLTERSFLPCDQYRKSAAAPNARFGESLKQCVPGSWVLCSTPWPMDWEGCLAFALNACRAWLISRCGQPLVKRRFGRLVLFCAPTIQTDELQSKG